MKKTSIILFGFLLICQLMACGKSDSQTVTEQNVTEVNAEEENVTEQNATEKNVEEQNITEQMETKTEETDSTEEDNKVLVAYFSATNNTKGIAEDMAEGLSADIFAIVPKEPYTDADLDYHDDNSRTSVEMNDPDARPEILETVENMETYDVIFLGYPIWWGEAPRIINTFLESYDFSGKTIIPFCTSGGSGIDASVSKLESLASDAKWLRGERWNTDASKEEIIEWADSLLANSEE